MKEFTNYMPGARGVNLSDGTTKWIEPGETVELDPKTIVGELPDLGKKSPRSEADTADLDALKDQVAELTKQVETLTAEKGEVEKANAELTKQVETLTKPPAK